MKIVILDGFTLNPGDLSWEGFKELGELKIYDRTMADQIVSRAENAEIIITNKTPLTEETINSLPAMKYIGVLATGYNVVDIEAAKKRDIPVTNIPTYGTTSVAQMVFALILEHCHHVASHSDAVMNGDWTKSKDFCFWNHPLIELKDKTIGIIGFGRIGQQTASISQAFGMNVIAYDKYQSDQSSRVGFKWASSIEQLLKESDIVSLHCPLFPDTEGIINKDSLSHMKKTAFLINTSRGPLINDNDLAYALNNDLIAGAGLDVLSKEPPGDNPLFKAKNCLITPHIAWATKEARSRLMGTAVLNLKSFLSGTPVNVVNKG
jgi:glycerate dehydrogenase